MLTLLSHVCGGACVCLCVVPPLSWSDRSELDAFAVAKIYAGLKV
jgi:hypothetical protein